MSEPLYCINHPQAETYLRCNRCGEPICVKCAMRTPVGYRCRDCIQTQQKVFYTDFRSAHYLIAAAVALPLALIAGWLVPIGWLYVLVLGPLAGGAIANLAHRAIGRRRGQYTWLVVCGCIIVGALPKLLVSLLSILGSVLLPENAGYITGGLMGLLWGIIYLVTAAGAAYAWLRPGRRN